MSVRCLPLPAAALKGALLLGALLPASASAVDGVSLTVHFEDYYNGNIGGYGAVWRHAIQNSVVVDNRELHQGPARLAVISNDGTRAAILLQGGLIVTMPLAGGEVRELIQGHEHGSIDWPAGDWLYYTLGGWDQTDTSRLLRRINVETGADEAVVEFSCGIWRFHISADAQRAVVRDRTCYGAIVTYDMSAGDGELTYDHATDSPSCSEGMDATGVHFIDGWTTHAGIDIRRWDTLEIVDSIAHVDADAWGGPYSGNQHNRNFWSANSPDWLCMFIGWDVGWNNQTNSWGEGRGGNQVLYDWSNHERIVVTGNQEDSDHYDSAGDFWVGPLSVLDAGTAAEAGVDSGPADAGAAADVAGLDLPNQPPVVDAGPDQTVALGSPALLVGEVQDDGLPSLALTMEWTQVSGPGTATIDSPDRARSTVQFDVAGTYVLRLSADDGELQAADEVSVTAAEPSLTLSAPSGGEVWTAGETQEIVFDAVAVDDVTITYSTDLGQTWELVEFSVDARSEGWGRFPWLIPDTPSTQCLVHLEPYNGGPPEATSPLPFEIRAAPDAGAGDQRQIGDGCACAQGGAGDAAGLLGLVFVLGALRRRCTGAGAHRSAARGGGVA